MKQLSLALLCQRGSPDRRAAAAFPDPACLDAHFEWQKLKSLPLGLEGCSWEGHTFFFFFPQPHKEYRIILKANIPCLEEESCPSGVCKNKPKCLVIYGETSTISEK